MSKPLLLASPARAARASSPAPAATAPRELPEAIVVAVALLALAGFIAIVTGAAGCVPAGGDGARAIASAAVTGAAAPPGAATADTLPVLAFAADWTVTQSGPPTGGGKALIHYDLARLPRCRTEYMGYPAWDILAYWSVDGGNASSTPLTQIVNGARVGVDVIIDVPPGHDLALWFYASDEGGCVQWDSNYGRNFHFLMQPGGPTIHFPCPGWDDRVDGTPTAGAELLVDYDVRRLAQCRQDYNGLPSWDVTVGYRFDDGAAASASLTTIAPDGQRVAAPARLAPPLGARSVTLWFENSDRTGCTAWDSRFGANYAFSLQ
jgi:hypothetical protein